MSATPHRQPIFNLPPVLVAVLALLLLVHVARQVLSADADVAVLAHLAFVPGRFTFALDPTRVLAHLAELSGNDGGVSQLAVADYFLRQPLQPWTPLTYALLHGNWAHLGLNAVWLLAFGAPVARRFGALRFMLFLALGCVAGAALHGVLFPFDFTPLVGISAGVSACMGAALRFMFQPARPLEPGHAALPAPALPIRRVFRDRRALIFFIVWFATNFVTGVGAVGLGLSEAPVAWQAHIGGFLFGLLAFRLFDRERPTASPPLPEEAPGQGPPASPSPGTEPV